jgi:hypothetical protein
MYVLLTTSNANKQFLSCLEWVIYVVKQQNSCKKQQLSTIILPIVNKKVNKSSGGFFVCKLAFGKVVWWISIIHFVFVVCGKVASDCSIYVVFSDSPLF